MPDIVLKDRDGNDVTYAGAVGVKMLTADGNMQVFSPDTGSSGDPSPCVFAVLKYINHLSYNSSSAAVKKTITFTLPAGSAVHHKIARQNRVISTSPGSTGSSSSGTAVNAADITKTETDDNVTVTYAPTGYTYTKYASNIWVAVVMFSVPGIYARQNSDGSVEIFADSTAMEWPSDANPTLNDQIHIVDLSESKITTLPKYAIYYTNYVEKVILPATITSLAEFAIYTSTCKIVDMSRCTAVPTIASSSVRTSVEQILVPSALYDEWIAATNWANFADKIVAV